MKNKKLIIILVVVAVIVGAVLYIYPKLSQVNIHEIMRGVHGG